MEPGADPRFISAYDEVGDEEQQRILTKRPSDPNIDVSDADHAGTKKRDSKATPQWIPSNSASSQAAMIHGEAVLMQQRQFVMEFRGQSPSRVASSPTSSIGIASPTRSSEGFSHGSQGQVPEQRGTRSRNRTRSRSGKEHSGRSGGRWTADEEEKLREGHEHFGDDWHSIAAHYFLNREGRTAEQCQSRWDKVLERGLVKGPWKEEEDQIIRDCIEDGMQKWSEIAKRVPGRVGKQCRERWHNHLDPNLKKSPWEEEEDAILIHAQKKWGNLWTKIARLIPGRSENQVKNRWHAATRRRPTSASESESLPVREFGDHSMKATPICADLMQRLENQKQMPRQMQQDRGSVNTSPLLLVDVSYDEVCEIIQAAQETVLQSRLHIPAPEGSPSLTHSRRTVSRETSPPVDESELPPALTMITTGLRSSSSSRLQSHRPPSLDQFPSSPLYSTSPSPTASSASSYYSHSGYSSDHSPEPHEDEVEFEQQMQSFSLNGTPPSMTPPPISNTQHVSGAFRDDAAIFSHNLSGPDRMPEPYFSGTSPSFSGNSTGSWSTNTLQYQEAGGAMARQQTQQHTSTESWNRLIEAAQTSAAYCQPQPHYQQQQQQQQQQQHRPPSASLHCDMPQSADMFNSGMAPSMGFQSQYQHHQPQYQQHQLHESQQAFQQPSYQWQQSMQPGLGFDPSRQLSSSSHSNAGAFGYGGGLGNLSGDADFVGDSFATVFFDELSFFDQNGNEQHLGEPTDL